MGSLQPFAEQPKVQGTEGRRSTAHEAAAAAGRDPSLFLSLSPSSPRPPPPPPITTLLGLVSVNHPCMLPLSAKTSATVSFVVLLLSLEGERKQTTLSSRSLQNPLSL